MAKRCSRYEASATQIDQTKWTEYAPTLIRYLGVTSSDHIDALEAIGFSVREDEQRLEFVVTAGERHTSIVVAYSLKPNTSSIMLSYSKDTVF